MSATTMKANGRAPRVVAPVPEPQATRPEGSQLAEAVLAVQGAAPTLSRNAKGQIQSRSYGYVTLDAIVDAVLPLLAEHGLVWRAWPTVNEHGQPALRYRMTHVPSGEFDEDEMPLLLAKVDMQGLGSAVTYGRRYALTAYLNLTVDQDDDGHGASVATSRATSQPSAAASKGPETPCSAAQRRMLRAKARAAKLTASQFGNALKASWGEDPVEFTDESAAERFIERALDRLPARLVDRVIELIEAEEVPF